MGVRRRRYGTESRWMVDIRWTHPDGRKERIRQVSPVQTRRGAERFEREVREALLNGTYGQEVETPEEVPTLEGFQERFLGFCAGLNKASELKSKRMVFRLHLVPLMGNRKLDDITTGLIEEYASVKLATGLSPKTVNNHLTVLRRALVKAYDWGLVEAVPTFEWLSTDDPEFDFFDFDEAERLIEGADIGQWETMILIALRTGLRQGELLALRWDDVDLKAGRLTVRQATWRGHVGSPKSKRSREVPLSGQALEALKRHRHLRGELVFCQEDGSPLTDGQCKWPLWRAARRAGLRRVGWHVLRHTFASHLVMRGVPLKAVQELMGHTTMEMTMRYAHLSPDVRRQAVEALDGAPDGHEEGTSTLKRS